MRKKHKILYSLLLIASLILPACSPQNEEAKVSPEIHFPQEPTSSFPTPTPLPTRPTYKPGELVDYTAQNGDTLPAVAAHFNTSVKEILAANPIIPKDATTLPPGMPMKVPIYYRNFWGTPYQIIPDSHFVNGPAVVGFDTTEFVKTHDGWLKSYVQYAAGANRTGAEIIDLIARNYSISPRVLLALAEYLAGALSSPTMPEESLAYPLGFKSYYYRGFYMQLIWAANRLNNGYYGWRTGELIEFELPDGTYERPDPWQNAATVAFQYLFSAILPPEQYRNTISSIGIAQTYQGLFGDSWEAEQPHIPGSLTQPGMLLPFGKGEVWAYTGGPHTAWGRGLPFAALDFAPSANKSGCYTSDAWTTAIAPGMVIVAESGYLLLDLDMDGDHRTGWVIFYLHIESRDLIEVGTIVEAGDPLGHPSCEGGTSTGTHIHIARKYNGEWMAADGPVPFVMEAWVPKNGDAPYEGTLIRYEKTVTACICATLDTTITATGSVDGIMQEEPEEEITPTPTP